MNFRVLGCALASLLPACLIPSAQALPSQPSVRTPFLALGSDAQATAPIVGGDGTLAPELARDRGGWMLRGAIAQARLGNQDPGLLALKTEFGTVLVDLDPDLERGADGITTLRNGGLSLLSVTGRSALSVRADLTGVSAFISLPGKQRTYDITARGAAELTTRPTPHGSIGVFNGPRLLAKLLAPVVVDSAGVQYRAEYKVRGKRITLEVDSRAAPGRPLAAMIQIEAFGRTGRWIMHPHSYPLAQRKLVFARGERNAYGSCVLSDQLLPRSGGPAELHELAIDPGTCATIGEEGVPPASVIREDERAGLHPPSVVAARSSAAAQATRVQQRSSVTKIGIWRPALPNGSYGNLAVLDGYTGTVRGWVLAPTFDGSPYKESRGWYKSIWEDPVGIDVNWVKEITDWHWGNGCVHNPTDQDFDYNYYGNTGWHLLDNIIDFQESDSCSQTRASTYAIFENKDFCEYVSAGSQDPTYTQFNRDAVFGKPNGTFTGARLTFAYGDCSSYLHHDFRTSGPYAGG